MHPLPRLASHGDILGFISEKDGGMKGKERDTETDLKREERNKTGEENYR